jgi:hypothetical protein
MLCRVGSFSIDDAGQSSSLPNLDPGVTLVACRNEEAPAVRPMESRQAVFNGNNI